MGAFFLFLLCGLGSLHAAAPVVSNISAAQRANSRLVDITYDVAADFPMVSVSLQVSSDGGSTFTVPVTTLSGAIGAGVTIGKAKKITWDAGKDWNGQYSSQMRFKVIADDGNSAPTISDITAQTINQVSNTGAIAFTVGDAQTAVGSLTLSGSSSNTTLVPTANIVFGGSGANRTVTVTPASSQAGTATITVTVSEGSLSASDTFVVAVNSAPANTAPTISDIAAQTINEGSNTGATAFTVGDAQTAAGSLTISGSSSNTTLVPNANIVFGGSGANRTVTVTPAIGQSGTATITVTVSDGSTSSSDTFVLTVNANTAPTISDIAALTINEGGNTGALTFTVGDAQTATGSLTLSGSSSNTTLVANANIVFGGSGENRTVTVAPVSGQSGTAIITVTVSDGSLTRSDSFVLTVNANSAPTISDIAALTIDQGGNTGVIAFTIGDAQTAAGSLTLSGSSSNTTLVPNANIVFGGSGANRTVTVTPASGQAGTATITVTVNDGSLTSSDTFVLMVNANSPPTISDIAPQTINEGGNTGALAFTIGDAQTAAGSLIVSGSSNNTTLVPTANIVFGGSGANRTVKVTPVSSQIGAATITVTVSDGSLTISNIFLLSVNTNTAPTISEVEDQTINQDGNASELAITIGDAQTNVFSLTLSGSSSNTTLVPNSNIIFGGSGANRTVTVTPASGQSGTATITVTVSDGSLSASEDFLITVNPAAPTNMALIPAGSFMMGDSIDGQVYAPINTVILDGFYMGKYEVTKAEWDEVRTWGLSNGYADLAPGSGKASNHPVQSITWYNMMKWCNARSQKEGLTPVYYTNDAQTTIYKTGNVDVTNAQVKWGASGYRLPTEAEWEKAARGGLSGKRFPWGDTISHSQANYTAYSGNDNYDLSSSWATYHPTYASRPSPYTSPVGAFAANGYGLYDMAGNVWEWCWDYYDSIYAQTGSVINPRGGDYYWGYFSSDRVIRGGHWNGGPDPCRVAHRWAFNPLGSQDYIGFRVVRGSEYTYPTISDIVDQTISENGRTDELAFMIDVARNDVSLLALSASSSDTNLVPNSNIVFGGSGANRTVTVSPASGQSGTVTITVMVSNGSLSSSDTFVLTVNANTSPTISDIKDQTINQDGKTSELAFTIGDVETNVSSLTISGSSSSTTLVPNANIVFGGSGVNRTVTVTPASGQSGTATITVTVSDGSLTRSDTFVLTVNSAPMISDIAAQTISVNGNTGIVAFTISDTQTAASYLTLSGSSSNTTLVPNAKIVFGGSGASRTVSVTPVSGQSGTATITVTVSDGSLTSSDTFVLTVNSAPTISNIAAQTIYQGSDINAIAFTVGDAQTAPGSLIVSGSSSDTTLVPNANIVFGGSGANRTVTVTPVSGQSGTVTITVTVSDGWHTGSDTFVFTVNSSLFPDFALIPAGPFTMGNSVAADTDITDAPTRTVTLDGFYMSKYEVTKGEWDEVRTWGHINGYTDLETGSGKANNYPVHSITWYQMVKWCNARSEKEGLTPVYYTNDAQTTIYKTGNVDVTNAQVKWGANGYRLPTEAEWEKAARGGLSGKRFPWGDTISHSQANYYARSANSYSYDLSGSVKNYHPSYNDGPFNWDPWSTWSYTSPVGSFTANGYGLYDMAGNVSEWCWDWYEAYDAGNQTNPRGAVTGTRRVKRGGSWGLGDADECRVARRNSGSPTRPHSFPYILNQYYGFRVLRSSSDTYPTISDILDQTISQDSHTDALSFTIDVFQNEVSSLTLSASSSDTKLVPNSNIVFGGSGANRTVTVTPASGQSGTATITVMVSNGSLTSSDTFVMKVNSGVPMGFTLIPAGAFTMGNSVEEDTDITDAPTHTVNLDAFYIGKYEVTKAEWHEVRTWGLSNGYTDLVAGPGTASNHPVHSLTWYDVVKWCNARSQKEGLTPVYYTNDAQTTIYKTGNVDVKNSQVKWSANGYRLPTEAEWEKAARGGLSGKRFPWGDTITRSQANYWHTYPSYTEDMTSAYLTPTTPMGSFAANSYGLYDIVGNVDEICWDWYGAYDVGSQTNPRGVSSGTDRVVRGGSWGNYANICRIAYRYDKAPSTVWGGRCGFRVARSIVANGGNTAPTISAIADQFIIEGSNTGALAFTIGDAQTAASSLTLSGTSSNTTLIPNANIVFGGSEANRTVTVTPASGQTGTAMITVSVSDGTLSASEIIVLTVTSAESPGLVLIPAGEFTMGDGYGDAPIRTVTLDAFYMGKYEVTKAEWDEVHTWGLSNGYTDLSAGSGKASNHPVQSITWYDIVKWCNARSQKEGLTPVYYTNDAQTTIYKTGNVNVSNAQVNWAANGYRLPTEAEWEKAARGGLSGKRFPWGDTISHSQANYSGGGYIYDLSSGYHPIYNTDAKPYTSPIGAFAANDYGLYDMAGNVSEWCWDWYGTYAAGNQTNPRGAISGVTRVVRGGSWASDNACEVAERWYIPPTASYGGFRVVRGSAP
jgi:formylglycine-generating enzyme required for sulfatase activity